MNDYLEGLRKKEQEYLNKLELIRELISEAEGKSNGEMPTRQDDFFDSSDGYDKKMTLRNKALFFIKKNNRFTHIREIGKMVKEREPNIDIDDFTKRLSPVLSRLKTDKILTNFKVGSSNRNVVWGSPKWLDADGKIFKEYLYDESVLIDSSEEEIEF